MKKVIFSKWCCLLFTLMVLVSCATVPKKPITKSDLSDLKGKWEGTRTTLGGVTALTDLEIYNDTLPLKGKLMVHNILVRGTTYRTETLEFNNGGINKEGNFMLQHGDNVFELSLYKGEGKMKLEGEYYYRGFRGKLVLYKK